MKKVVLTIFNLSLPLIGAVLIYGSSGGRATTQNDGNTGAPGDNPNYTCISCHSPGSNIQIDVDIKVLDSTNAEITAYEPGKTYSMEVEITPTTGSPAGYGFQVVCLEDNNNTGLPGWSNPGPNVQLATANGGRKYAEHDGVSSSNVFAFDWTAPDSGTGNITFYAGGNGVNGNGLQTGDGADTTSLTLNEQGNPAGLQQAGVKANARIFPNPVTDRLTVQHATGRYTIYSITGKQIQSGSITGKTSILDLSAVRPGIYFMEISNREGQQRFTQKLVVQ